MKTLKDAFTGAVTWFRSARFRARIAVVICAVGAFVGGLMFARNAMAQVAPPSPPASDSEINAAIAASLATVLSNPSHPTDPEGLQTSTMTVFAASRPDLAVQELQKDAAFVQAQSDAFATILHPEGVEAAIQKDPVALQARAEGLRMLTQGVGDSTVEYYKALSAKLPTPEQARQEDERLWNDPEWQRQRLAPFEAVAPNGQSPNPTGP
jgi:hypothetical protein